MRRSIQASQPQAHRRAHASDWPSSYQGFFIRQEAFYAVALHELGHWTGAKPRLDRDLSSRFGTKAYAAEELVAEMTAAFLCAHLDIKGELRHASYISNWIKLLEEDTRRLMRSEQTAF